MLGKWSCSPHPVLTLRCGFVYWAFWHSWHGCCCWANGYWSTVVWEEVNQQGCWRFLWTQESCKSAFLSWLPVPSMWGVGRNSCHTEASAYIQWHFTSGLPLANHPLYYKRLQLSQIDNQGSGWRIGSHILVYCLISQNWVIEHTLTWELNVWMTSTEKTYFWGWSELKVLFVVFELGWLITVCKPLLDLIHYHFLKRWRPARNHGGEKFENSIISKTPSFQML